jgi:cyclohexadienyl dehydratase
MRKRTIMRKSFLSFIALAGAVSIAALSAMPLRARPLAAIKADGTLKVGMTGDYAPYSLRDANGQISGADVTMARGLAQALNVKLDMVPTTWKALTQDFQAGLFDIAMGGVSITPDRSAIGDFSIPVLQDGKRPIVRCADKDRYISIVAIDKPEVRVATNPGGTNQRFDKAHFTHAILEEFLDNRSIFDELAMGHADVMITDGAEVDYQARLHPGVLCPASVSGPFDHFEKAYWMTSDPALKEAVDAWLKETLKSGLYEKALTEAAASHH